VNAATLLAEIEEAFPRVEMPKSKAIVEHAEGCIRCGMLAEDIESYRDKPLDQAFFRSIHQELSLLSASGWAWLLPHYLPYCLQPEVLAGGSEVEYFVYNMCPHESSEEGSLAHLSALKPQQLACAIHFLEFLQAHSHWAEYCPTEIEAGLRCLRATNA
jgi:hypothetical protein